MFLLPKKNKSDSHLLQSEATDLSVVERYKRTGDKALVGILFQRYTYLVYSVCYKYLNNQEDSKDAVMQIFEELLEKLKVHDIQNFKSWLHSVAKNHCLMKLRSSKKEVRLFDDFSEKKAELIMESEEDLHLHDRNEFVDRHDQLHAAIKKLNEEQGRCILLMYIENKSYKEISEITGYDLKKVKSHIQNGKRNLKLILSSYDES
ncbi:MAG: sigma-70 family RNA polymerase sigma factor [Bacteroidales bacterium]|nr:sigma-70 family RNA polymerase sigma factor [Bacteroidales bacterium]